MPCCELSGKPNRCRILVGAKAYWRIIICRHFCFMFQSIQVNNNWWHGWTGHLIVMSYANTNILVGLWGEFTSNNHQMEAHFLFNMVDFFRMNSSVDLDLSTSNWVDFQVANKTQFDLLVFFSIIDFVSFSCQNNNFHPFHPWPIALWLSNDGVLTFNFLSWHFGSDFFSVLVSITLNLIW